MGIEDLLDEEADQGFGEEEQPAAEEAGEVLTLLSTRTRLPPVRALMQRGTTWPLLASSCTAAPGDCCTQADHSAATKGTCLVAVRLPCSRSAAINFIRVLLVMPHAKQPAGR